MISKLSNKKFIITMCIASLFSGDCMALTLQEKIELAKHLADEGTSGKAQMGRVVSGNFDFNKELENFKSTNNLSTQIPDIDDQQLLADLESTEIEPIETIEKPVTQEPVVQQDTTVIEPIVEPIETVEKPAIQESVAQQDTTAIEPIVKPKETIEIAQADVPKATMTQPTSDMIKPKAEKKYEIDTSQSFINGYLVGTIDSDEKEIEQVKEINSKLDQLDKEFNANILSYSANLFDLISDDKNAHSFMIPIVNACESVINNYFTSTQAKIVLPNKIRLQLVANTDENIKGNFDFSISELGDTSLVVYYNKSLKFSDFCRVIMGSVLRKLAYTYGGSTAVETVPVWLEYSMGKMLEQYLAYGVVSELADISDKYPLLDIETVFNMKRDDVNDITIANAYWVLQSLPTLFSSKSNSAKFLSKSLLGDNSKDLVSYLYKSNKNLQIKDGKQDMQKFNLWWRAVLTGEIWQRKGGVYDFERSESEIARLAVIQANTIDGHRIGFSPKQVFDNIENLKSEVELRLMEIKLSFMKINPAYYNCLVSLGSLFEAILDEDEDDFAKANKAFVTDITYARIIAKETDNLLDNK